MDRKIHFGTLEAELLQEQNHNNNVKSAVSKGNVNITNVESETLGLSSSTIKDQIKHAEALKKMEMKRLERKAIVPTDDIEVKEQLRSRGQPICLFGERESERRSRLKQLVALEGIDLMSDTSSVDENLKDSNVKETFYSPASEQLIQARIEFASNSFKAARQRLQAEKIRKSSGEAFLQHSDLVDRIFENVKSMQVIASQIGDRRPINCCSISSDSKLIATGSFSGVAKIWEKETFQSSFNLAEHEDRIVDLKFSHNDILATASADCKAKIWKIPNNSMSDDDTSVSLTSQVSLVGHIQRLSCLAWHPIGKHVGTSSYDRTWRLWDVETGQEILLQDGHEFGVYGFAIHVDGSLAMSGDLAGVTRLWDLRSGKSIDSLKGHVKEILSIDFASNGYLAATGSSDHTARIWDLRMRKSLFAIPGHMSIVSRVVFDKLCNCFLATSSYDGTTKLWSTSDGKLIREPLVHDNKVMDVAISSDAENIVTTSYDRTWKLWGYV